MGKTNLTSYSENELSLNVFNEESLYRVRHTACLMDIIDETFEYTEDQKEVLLKDLAEDLREC